MPNSALNRSGLVPIILIPQVAVLVLFLFSQFDVWRKLFAGAELGLTGLAYFFLELVSHGAGWAMLSLSALAASLAVHQGSASTFYAALAQDRFERATAEEVAAALSREARQHKTMHVAVITLFALIAIVGLFSFAGALVYADIHYPDRFIRDTPIFISYSVLTAFILAGLSWTAFSGTESELNLDRVMEQLWPQQRWTPESLLAWDAANAAGRLNVPKVKIEFESIRANLMHNLEFAEEVLRIKAQD